MDAMLGWIKGIMGCLLIMSLILQFAPGKIYRPYLRLFMGIVLILTMIGPLTEAAGLVETLETLVGELAYEEISPGWEEKLLEGGNWAEEQIIAKAEEMSREAAVSAEPSAQGTHREIEPLTGDEEGEKNEEEAVQAAEENSVAGGKIEVEAIARVKVSGDE